MTNEPSDLDKAMVAAFVEKQDQEQAELKRRQQAVKDQQGKINDLRNVIAGELGVSLTAWDRVVAEFQGKAKEEVSRYLLEMRKLGKALSLPFFQLIDEQKPEAEALEDRAWARGYQDGINGKGSDANPHEAGVAAFQWWLDGWHDGSRALLEGRKKVAPIAKKAEREAAKRIEEKAKQRAAREAKKKADAEQDEVNASKVASIEEARKKKTAPAAETAQAAAEPAPAAEEDGEAAEEKPPAGDAAPSGA